MSILNKKSQLIPKHQKGSGEKGIQIQHNGPQYYEIIEQMKKEDPDTYNRLQIEIARKQNPNSEVVIYTDADGNQRRTTNIGSGFVSGTDPIGSEIVAGVVLGKPLQLIGKSLVRQIKPTNTYTQDLIKLLGSKKTPQGHMGQRSSFTQEFANYLENLGVQTSKLSDQDLRYLQHLRQQSIENSIPKQGRITLVEGSPYTKKYTLYNDGSELGLLDTYVNKQGQEIANIRSLNSNQKGVSMNLYDSALKYGQQTNNRGLISGQHLLSPEQTKHIWNKYYPNRKTINHSGRHEYNTGDFVNKTGEQKIVTDGIVVDLNTPYSNIPVKSIDIFHPNMIDKTTWTLKSPNWQDDVPYYKQGSKIHIKKKNRGKFTEYCGGKVTDECISRAKKSKNPKLRKRATFAANSRRWSKKHQEGGWLEMLPVYGTYKSAERFVDNPSWSGAVETGLSLLGDVGMVTGVGALAKFISGANKARKAYKTARIAEQTANTARDNFWKAQQGMRKVKHNEGVINSLSIQPRTAKTDQLIIDKIKQNQVLNQNMQNARIAEKTATSNMKNAYQNSYNLHKEAASNASWFLPSITSTIGSQAAKVAIGTNNGL